MWSTSLAYAAGEPEAGLGHAQQALEIAERIGDAFSRGWSWFWLGLAERMRERWQPAIDALERSVSIAAEHRTAMEGHPWRLAVLAESYLGLGDPERARALVTEGLALARARGLFLGELHGNLALARVLNASAGQAARAEIEAALGRALELARDAETKAVEPLVHVELAELARQSGDRAGHTRELSEAHRLFTEIGAAGHAARLAAAAAG